MDKITIPVSKELFRDLEIVIEHLERGKDYRITVESAIRICVGVIADQIKGDSNE